MTVTVVVEPDRIGRAAPAATAAARRARASIDGSGKFLIAGPLGHARPHVLRRLGPGRARGDAAAAARERRDRRARHGQRSRPDPRGARGRGAGERCSARGSSSSGPMLDGPKSQFPAALEIGTPEEGRARRGDARRARRRLHQDPVVRSARRVLRDRRGVPRAGRSSSRVTFPTRSARAEASDAGPGELRAPDRRVRGQLDAEDALLEGAEGPGAVSSTPTTPRRSRRSSSCSRRSETWQCPTLFWERGQWLVDAIDVAGDPDCRTRRFLARRRRGRSSRRRIIKDLDTDPLDVRQRFVEHELAIVKRLHDRGRAISRRDRHAGRRRRDPGAEPPPRARALRRGRASRRSRRSRPRRSARREFLGRAPTSARSRGARSPTSSCSTRNPLEDIRNTRRIAAVVANGRYLSRADLDRILADIQAYAKTH